MNVAQTWLIFGLILIFTALLGIGCKSFFSSKTEQKKPKVAENVHLNQNWTEIVPQTSFKATAKNQNLQLKISNVKGWADKDQKNLLLTNGSNVKVEIELIGENNRTTILLPNGFGEYVEFGKRAENKENVEESQFQIGETFNKIRLRSDTPIEVSEIIWSEFEF